MKMVCNKPLQLCEFEYELFPVPLAFAKLQNDFWKDPDVLMAFLLNSSTKFVLHNSFLEFCQTDAFIIYMVSCLWILGLGYIPFTS